MKTGLDYYDAIRNYMEYEEKTGNSMKTGIHEFKKKNKWNNWNISEYLI